MDCKAELTNDVLVLENVRIRREYDWHGGVLASRAVTDKVAGKRWEGVAPLPDLVLPGESSSAARVDGTIQCAESGEYWENKHLAVEVVCRFADLEVKRVFRLFEDCPAIACELYVRGRSAASSWLTGQALSSDEVLSKHQWPGPAMERFPFGQRHVRLESVQFFDRTDCHDTLVQRQEAVSFRFPVGLQGNLLLGTDTVDDAGFFILKEAACANVQFHNPGCDFMVYRGSATVLGIGVEPKDLWDNDWLRCYGTVTGVAAGGRSAVLAALNHYQRTRRPSRPGRDEMVILNTWGDRGGAGRVNEAFVMHEIKAGARLGVTHLQIDDGWQVGNFSDPGERPLKIGAFWDVNREKFPGGLAPVVAAARAAGIEICVWYAPECADDYRHWENNADILIRLHREHGIRIFKNDGIDLASMRGAANLRRMFERVIRETQGEAYFNVDVTAGRRLGFHGLSEYGDVFVENRYTDWGNYYPHRTLRNLWQLAHYLPTQILQMEFLNVWRNAKKYASDDPLAPQQVPFEYAFAICMMAQPLAWFEASELPEAASLLRPVLRVYKEHMARLHAGQVVPIGEAPTGSSWCGFQSENGGTGYVLAFRELTHRPSARLHLQRVPRVPVAFRALAGAGADFLSVPDSDGGVEFKLPAPFSYALYHYRSALTL